MNYHLTAFGSWDRLLSCNKIIVLQRAGNLEGFVIQASNFLTRKSIQRVGGSSGVEGAVKA